MAVTKDEILEAIASMSVLELSQLINLLLYNKPRYNILNFHNT